MKIDLNIMEEVFYKLMVHVKNKGIDLLEIDEDYYWNIKQSQRYNPNITPSDFDLGQLEDDWNEIKKLKNDTEIGRA